MLATSAQEVCREYIGNWAIVTIDRVFTEPNWRSELGYRAKRRARKSNVSIMCSKWKYFPWLEYLHSIGKIPLVLTIAKRLDETHKGGAVWEIETRI